MPRRVALGSGVLSGSGDPRLEIHPGPEPSLIPPGILFIVQHRLMRSLWWPGRHCSWGGRSLGAVHRLLFKAQVAELQPEFSLLLGLACWWPGWNACPPPGGAALLPAVPVGRAQGPGPCRPVIDEAVIPPEANAETDPKHEAGNATLRTYGLRIPRRKVAPMGKKVHAIGRFK